MADVLTAGAGVRAEAEARAGAGTPFRAAVGGKADTVATRTGLTAARVLFDPICEGDDDAIDVDLDVEAGAANTETAVPDDDEGYETGSADLPRVLMPATDATAAATAGGNVTGDCGSAQNKDQKRHAKERNGGGIVTR